MKRIFILIVLSLSIIACRESENSVSVDDGTESRRLTVEELEAPTTGKVKYLNIEGGFWVIIGDNGGKYDPTNLPDEYKKEGLNVKFKAKVLQGVGSFHMWGHVVELEEIQGN